MIGRALGHYQITEKLGEGGMGVVYRARDTHLDRFVAIKVLAAERVADPDRKRRFVQEAKAASALNHPNIVTIHDIAQEGGTDFIAMEWVEGKTLDQLIPRKGMRLGEVLKYSAQVADALATAHAAGIVHRDLKPANVMVTEKGLVKVLDFGLAKLTERTESNEPGTTETMEPRTEEGTIVGTVAFMSPEQAEGKKIDRRSDIFSFGSMLYEMLTGQRAFRGDTRASTIASILRDEPKPISEVAGALPRDVEKLVRRCLQKDVLRRFQHMDDVKVALEELKEESESGVLETAAPAASKRASRAMYAVIAVVVLVLVGAGGYWLSRQRPAEPEAPLVPVPLTTYHGWEYLPSFSPDGNYVAFQWDTEGIVNSNNIYIKQIGVEPPERLTRDPSNSWGPAWSPDGRFVAYFRTDGISDTLMVTPQRGGQERALAQSDFMCTAAWTPDSKWLVWSQADQAGRGLFLISTQTEEKRRLTANQDDSDPAVSPDGRTLAFTRLSINEPHVYLLHLGEGYIPQGEPEKIAGIAERISYGPAWMPDGSEILFVSRDTSGTFLWRIALRNSARPRRLHLPSDIAHAGRFALSPRGDRLAYSAAKGGNTDIDIWAVDARNQGNPVRLISSTRQDGWPAFAPDCNRIAFTSDRSGYDEIWVCKSDGSNPVPLTSFKGPMVLGSRWSPDGQRIALTASPGGNVDIYVISASGGVAHRLTTSPAAERHPYWSRDGKSIYFSSNRSGSLEIWKMPAGGGDPVQITSNGEAPDLPQESPDGKFVYYQKGWPSQCSVWRAPVAGGEEARVLDSVDCNGQWTVGEQGVYFCSTADTRGRRDIRLYEFATGKVRKLLTIDGGVVETYIAVSPDGGTILYPHYEQAPTDLMLVEDFH